MASCRTLIGTTLYRRLAEDVSNGEVDKNLAEVITRLIQLLIPYRQGRIHPVSIGLNIIALAWVLNPGLLRRQPFAPGAGSAVRRPALDACQTHRPLQPVHRLAQPRPAPCLELAGGGSPRHDPDGVAR